MSTERDTESGFSEGDDVTIQIDAKVVEDHADETVLVDADGKEILVDEGEIR